MARSMGGGDLVAWPQLEWPPLMHWMAERKSKNVRRQCNQNEVEEYGWSQFATRHEASLLYKVIWFHLPYHQYQKSLGVFNFPDPLLVNMLQKLLLPII